MQWVLAFGAWKAMWWRQQASWHSGVSSVLSEGLAAYVIDHAKYEEARARDWAEKWAPVCVRAKTAFQSIAAGTLKVIFPPLEVDIDLQLEDESAGSKDDDDL